MKPFRILFSPLIFSLFFSSCHFTRELQPSVTTISPERFSPIGEIGGTLLFKTRFKAYGHHLSGLFLLKPVPEDTAIRVLLLSELGLNLLDMEYSDDRFRVVSVDEFLDRKVLLKTLQDDFRTLLLDLRGIDDYRVMKDEKENAEVLQFRQEGERYSYHYRKGSGTFKIERRPGPFHRVEMILTGNGKRVITVRHRGIRISLNLQQLDKLEGNSER